MPSTSEFEIEPVPPRALLGFKSFVGMYAGEHCAGTELMIGPLFVASGVSAFDIVFGLLLGNALAVLSWMYLTAPIAVRSRLTLYCQLEKICGRRLATLYNLANGIMFCFLAGSMITVSATAVGVWIDFPMPGLNDIFPNSAGWVIAVFVVGAAISIVAACGYEMVSRIANLAAPWMVLVFLAFGLVGLKQFITQTSAERSGLSFNWAAGLTWFVTLAVCAGLVMSGIEINGFQPFQIWFVALPGWFIAMGLYLGLSKIYQQPIT